ncbi:MAG: transcription elongation factor GreA [Parcubacteria group bacterium Licking1014_17]|nr:MAG: transcription elongation factor GreA [Parcubacteria group bacterium Licking1014_17]
MANQYFTREGLEKLKEELRECVEKIRPEIAAKIYESKELGDISENAEFAEAKNAQAMNEGKIEELTEIIKNAVIIEHEIGHQDVIAVGSTVKAKSSEGVKVFTIVGIAETNPAAGLISNQSPLGTAFLGHKKGDKVEVNTPGGKTEYKILEVS